MKRNIRLILLISILVLGVVFIKNIIPNYYSSVPQENIPPIILAFYKNTSGVFHNFEFISGKVIGVRGSHNLKVDSEYLSDYDKYGYTELLILTTDGKKEVVHLSSVSGKIHAPLYYNKSWPDYLLNRNVSINGLKGKKNDPIYATLINFDDVTYKGYKHYNKNDVTGLVSVMGTIVRKEEIKSDSNDIYFFYHIANPLISTTDFHESTLIAVPKNLKTFNLFQKGNKVKIVGKEEKITYYVKNGYSPGISDSEVRAIRNNPNLAIDRSYIEEITEYPIMVVSLENVEIIY